MSEPANKTAVYRTRRRVMAHPPMEDEIAAFAGRLGWKQVHAAAADVETATNHEVIWQGIEGLALSYFESYFTGDCCLAALGDGPDLPERFIDEVDKAFADSILFQGELIDRVEDAETPPQLGRALIGLGLGAPIEWDQEVFELLAGYASEPDDERIRNSALIATMYTDWREFIPMLRTARRDDPSELVRTRAEILLDAFENVFGTAEDPR